MVTEIIVEIQGLEGAIGGIDAIDGSVAQNAPKNIGTYVTALRNNIRNATPRRTGILADSTQRQDVGKTMWAIVQTASAENRLYPFYYGRAVRGGSKPPGGTGYIYPRLKKALYWAGLSRPISQVGPPVTDLHPGITKAVPYVKDGVKASKSAMKKMANDIAKDVASQTSRHFGSK